MSASDRDHSKAVEFCKLVQTTDLFEYLGVSTDAPWDDVKEALSKKRRRLQSMQSNPKFRESARFLIKNVRAFERVLEVRDVHLERMRLEREREKIPMLEFAIDSVLADGVLSPEEESFVRSSALALDISEATYQRVLEERAADRGVSLPEAEEVTGPVVFTGEFAALSTEDASETTQERKLRGAQGHSWWDAAFTRLLLECIPGGPGDLVDIYCRTALSALTLLPERQQLDWLGIDRSTDRLENARQILAGRDRVRFANGTPDALPIQDESVDFVLGIRALANQPDTEPVFAEAMRVLRPGGRMILAEPDGLGETFFFDQHLSVYNAVFHRLCRQVDDAMTGEAKRPIGKPGLSIGPQLAERMEAAGLKPSTIKLHASHNLKMRSFGKFSRLLRRYPRALARQAGLDDSAMGRLNKVVDVLVQAIPDDHVGLCGNLLPMFLVVGVKEN